MSIRHHRPYMAVVAMGLGLGVAGVGAYAQQQPGQQEQAQQQQQRQQDQPQQQQQQDQQQAAQQMQLQRANELIGMQVQNYQGEELGTVQDIVLDHDVRGGQISYVALEFGGWFGVGGDLHAIPFEALEYDDAEQTLILDASQQELEEAPGFDADQWPDRADPRWRQVDQFYGVERQQNGQPMQQRMQQRMQQHHDRMQQQRSDQQNDRRRHQLGSGQSQQQDTFGRDQNPQQNQYGQQQSGQQDRFGNGQYPQQETFGRDQSQQRDQLGNGQYRQRDAFGRDQYQQQGRDGNGQYPQQDRLEYRQDQYRQQDRLEYRDDQYGQQSGFDRDQQQYNRQYRRQQQGNGFTGRRGDTFGRSQQGYGQGVQGRSGYDAGERGWVDDRRQGQAQQGQRQQDQQFGRESYQQNGGVQWSRRLSEVIGTSVENAQGESLGQVEDVIVDLDRGVAAYAVVSYGGVLGVGEEQSVVPWTAAQVDTQRETLVLEASPQQLEQTPFEDVEALADQQQAQQIHQQYQAQPYWEIFALPRRSGQLDPQQLQGWQQLDQQYDQEQSESFAGTIESIGTFRPTPDAAPGVRYRLRTEDGQAITVYAGPRQFHQQQERRQNIEIQQGDQIEVSGAPAEVDRRTVLLAQQITKDGQTLQLRNEQGEPEWGQAPMQQQRNQLQQQQRQQQFRQEPGQRQGQQPNQRRQGQQGQF